MPTWAAVLIGVVGATVLTLVLSVVVTVALDVALRIWGKGGRR